MRLKSRLALTFLLAALGANAEAAAPQAEAPPAIPTDWQSVARADLDAAHRLILEAHPGAIDQQNPQFGDWVEAGYQEGLALLPEVTDYVSANSAVRYYTTGFRDGHLSYSDQHRPDNNIVIDGWMVDLVGHDYLVSATADGWPGDLPPKDAVLFQCDGRTPQEIIKADVAPFYDRRDLPGIHRTVAKFMTAQFFEDRRLKQCTFKSPDGALLAREVHYQRVDMDVFRSLLSASTPARHWANSFTFENGVLWIHAGNFSLNRDDELELETMLKALRAVKGARTIVFDSRGNPGGDDSVGDRIFRAATGGLQFDQKGLERLPRTYAQWRVSTESIATIEDRFNHDVSLYGAKSERAKETHRFLLQMQAAQKTGLNWVEQDGGRLTTREEMKRRHARLRRFTGKVGLVTDSGCASACLDFADLVRGVPGSVHVGETTSADSVYIDIGFFGMPSGNTLVLPLKAWRNRLRGNNEPLQPDVPLRLPENDEPALRTATLAAINSRSP